MTVRQAVGFAGEQIDAIGLESIERKRNAKPVRHSMPMLQGTDRRWHDFEETKPWRRRVENSVFEVQGVRVYSAGWFE